MNTKKTIPIYKDDTIINPVLSEQVEKLREQALEERWIPSYHVSTMPLVDFQSWTEYTDKVEETNYQDWRVERAVGRMRRLPLNIEVGEIIVGKPLIQKATDSENLEMQQNEEEYNKIFLRNACPPGDCGHFTPDYEKLLTLGIGGIRAEIHEYSQGTNDKDKKKFYEMCDKSMEATTEYVLRVVEECEKLGLKETAIICRNVSINPPKTFKEAVQLIFFAIFALWYGEDHGLTTLGRLDQILWPFYKNGDCTRQEALEIISCLYILLNRILEMGAAESLIVGGRDKNGNDVTNELTYICLSARAATRLIYPTVGLGWHEKTPKELMEFSCKMLATGVGDPAFFNDEVISKGLMRLGVTKEDSYNYINSTCVEIKVAGASHIWVTAPYINCPLVFLETLEKIVKKELPEPKTFNKFIVLVKSQMALAIEKEVKLFDGWWSDREHYWGSPVASCLINDCLEKGIDFDKGGARYNWVENAFVGLANLADSCFSIKKLVYENDEYTLEQLQKILENDYKDEEALRQRIITRISKYGNNIDEVDDIAVDWADYLIDETESHTVGRHHYVAGFFCWQMHQMKGAVTGATLDGRKAKTPFADGAGSSQGRDISGPTESILSTTKWDHSRVMGGLVLNMKFTKEMISSEEGLKGMQNLIEVYLKRGGFETQINIIEGDELLKAQKNPEAYADLLVRVAGYSCYFTILSRDMQDEIISRTELKI